ncbi:hypothetical protein FRC02_007714 [Tulasnella sp. 418]|nr:hypothetical protein FRC02_007714 [Tulasnella sp. 418]
MRSWEMTSLYISFSSDIAQLVELLIISPIRGEELLYPVTQLLNETIGALPDPDSALMRLPSEFWKCYSKRWLREWSWSFQILSDKIVGRMLQPGLGSLQHSTLQAIQIPLSIVSSVYQATMTNSMDQGLVQFFNWLMNEDTELQWPAYLVTAGFIPSNVYQGGTSAGRASSINHMLLEEYLKDYSRAVDRRIWWGEAILLLWKKGQKEWSLSSFSLENDPGDMFFERIVVEVILRYWREIQKVRTENPERFEQHDVETETLEGYLKRAVEALQGIGYNDDEFSEEEVKERAELGEEVTKVLEEVETLKRSKVPDAMV